MRWFRFYDEVLDDPKVQRLPAKTAWAWVKLLCLANRGTPRGRVPAIPDIAFALRIKERTAAALMETLENGGLMEALENGGWTPHGWTKRQPESDDSLPRVRRLRYGNDPEAVTRTPPEERRGEEIQKQRRVDCTDAGFVVESKLLFAWQQAYPAVDVQSVLRHAHAWTLANPANKKSNWHRFLVGWLKREQDRAPARLSNQGRPGQAGSPHMPIRPAVLEEQERSSEELAANRQRAAAMAAEVAAKRAMPPTMRR